MLLSTTFKPAVFFLKIHGKTHRPVRVKYLTFCCYELVVCHCYSKLCLVRPRSNVSYLPYTHLVLPVKESRSLTRPAWPQCCSLIGSRLWFWLVSGCQLSCRNIRTMLEGPGSLLKSEISFVHSSCSRFITHCSEVITTVCVCNDRGDCWYCLQSRPSSSSSSSSSS